MNRFPFSTNLALNPIPSKTMSAFGNFYGVWIGNLWYW